MIYWFFSLRYICFFCSKQLNSTAPSKKPKIFWGCFRHHVSSRNIQSHWLCALWITNQTLLLTYGDHYYLKIYVCIIKRVYRIGLTAIWCLLLALFMYSFSVITLFRPVFVSHLIWLEMWYLQILCKKLLSATPKHKYLYRSFGLHIFALAESIKIIVTSSGLVHLVDTLFGSCDLAFYVMWSLHRESCTSAVITWWPSHCSILLVILQ